PDQCSPPENRGRRTRADLLKFAHSSTDAPASRVSSRDEREATNGRGARPEGGSPKRRARRMSEHGGSNRSPRAGASASGGGCVGVGPSTVRRVAPDDQLRRRGGH